MKKEPCPDCGKVHDDELERIAEIATNVATEFSKFAFPKIWNDIESNRAFIKKLNQKELSSMMFQTGATQMLVHFIEDMKERGVDLA